VPSFVDKPKIKVPTSSELNNMRGPGKINIGFGPIAG
jgi:hypothetical protein